MPTAKEGDELALGRTSCRRACVPGDASAAHAEGARPGGAARARPGAGAGAVRRLANAVADLGLTARRQVLAIHVAGVALRDAALLARLGGQRRVGRTLGVLRVRDREAFVADLRRKLAVSLGVHAPRARLRFPADALGAALAPAELEIVRGAGGAFLDFLARERAGQVTGRITERFRPAAAARRAAAGVGPAAAARRAAAGVGPAAAARRAARGARRTSAG